jgi:membrane protein DedA with SNARE-associated domain
MDVEAFKIGLVAFVQHNQGLAPLIVGALAFCESLAFLSLLIPATVLLIGIGALIGAADIAFAPIWLGAATGAILGDWVSYTIGRYFQNSARSLWPLRNSPTLVDRAEIFFKTHGAWGVFAGRFFGPLRAFVPLVAGIFAMPFLLFQCVNVASAFVWSFLMLAPGAGLMQALPL